MVKNTMIPKRIHWCWLSGEEKPNLIKKCLESWKVLGDDFEIMLWDADSIDWTFAPKFIQQALEDQNWALVSDFVRAYALYRKGGWYFDSDVELKKPIPEEYYHYDLCATKEPNADDNFMAETGFKNTEGTPIFGNCINTALMGARKGCPYLREVMDFYDTVDYSVNDYPNSMFGWYIAPQVYSFVAEKYGYLYNKEPQLLSNNMYIAPETLCVNKPYTKNEEDPIAVHHCSFSWFNKIKQ